MWKMHLLGLIAHREAMCLEHDMRPLQCEPVTPAPRPIQSQCPHDGSGSACSEAMGAC